MSLARAAVATLRSCAPLPGSQMRLPRSLRRGRSGVTWVCMRVTLIQRLAVVKSKLQLFTRARNVNAVNAAEAKDGARALPDGDRVGGTGRAAGVGGGCSAAWLRKRARRSRRRSGAGDPAEPVAVPAVGGVGSITM